MIPERVILLPKKIHFMWDWITKQMRVDDSGYRLGIVNQHLTKILEEIFLKSQNYSVWIFHLVSSKRTVCNGNTNCMLLVSFGSSEVNKILTIDMVKLRSIELIVGPSWEIITGEHMSLQSPVNEILKFKWRKADKIKLFFHSHRT